MLFKDSHQQKFIKDENIRKWKRSNKIIYILKCWLIMFDVKLALSNIQL